MTEAETEWEWGVRYGGKAGDEDICHTREAGRGERGVNRAQQVFAVQAVCFALLAVAHSGDHLSVLVWTLMSGAAGFFMVLSGWGGKA